jgi:hypothetical protein
MSILMQLTRKLLFIFILQQRENIVHTKLINYCISSINSLDMLLNDPNVFVDENGEECNVNHI